MWDIETVLRYLRSLPINELLSTKRLALKLTMLLALTSASRYSKIRHLDIRFYANSERKFCFNVIKPTKMSTKNKPLPVLEFERFRDDNNICVFETLEEYIFRVKLWQEKSNHTQLLSHSVRTASTSKAKTLGISLGQIVKKGQWSKELT